MHIDEFDTLAPQDARAQVAVWAAVPTWVDAVVSGRPYGSTDALAARAQEVATGWGRAELDAALAHHPRIGEKPSGTGADADASRREQASMADAGDDVAALMTAGNRAYEERFGRVFLIRAAGRSPDQMLGELARRLDNDEATEVAEACDQLAQIALLRLHGAVTDGVDTREPAP